MKLLRSIWKLFCGKQREKLLWMHPDSSGCAQIGRPVNIDGRTGRVVDGTELTIIVEWD